MARSIWRQELADASLHRILSGMEPKNGETTGRVGPILLALLVNSGQIKSSPIFAWIPVDLTLILTVFVCLLTIQSRLNKGPAVWAVVVPLIIWVTFLPPIGLSILDQYSISKISLLFFVTLTLAVSPFYLLREKGQRHLFLISLAVVAFLFVLTTLSQVAGSSEIGRVTSDTSNTIGTARVAMTGAIVLCLGLFNNGISSLVRIIMAGGTLLSVVLGILTGSRGPVFSAIFAVFLVVLLVPAFRGQRIKAIIGMSIVGSVAFEYSNESNSGGLTRIVAGSETSDGARIAMWQQALDTIVKTPFGIGWGQFDPPNTLLHGYPHNLFLEVGVEAGWLPMFALFLLVVSTIILGFIRSTSTQEATFFGLFLFALTNALVSNDINGNRLFWVALFTVWCFSIRPNVWVYPHLNERKLKKFRTLT